MQSSPKRIFISTSTFGKYDASPLEKLRKSGYAVEVNPYGRKLTVDEQLKLYKGIDGLIAGTESLNGDVLKSLPGLRVISRCGVGLDNVDLDAAERLGISVHNTPDAPTLAVAELTVALILNLLRKTGRMTSALAGGKWKKEMGNLVHGKRIGIIGFGRIGQKVAELLSGFGAELTYCDVEDKGCVVNCERKGLEEILGWADIITLHLSVSGDSGVVIGEKELKKMRKGTWLINLSRGGAVDEEALYMLLKDGYLEGAALDVFGQEPYIGPLVGLENALLTPHVGSYAREARIRMENEAVDNLLADLVGRDQRET
ncbi:phosphoglycerate dehydrogenase [Candidatus Omnitrophota bacterium]